MTSRITTILILCGTILVLLVGTTGQASQDSGDYNIHLPLTFQNYIRKGFVSGVVTNERTGLPIESGLVCLAGSTNCAVTDSLGAYSLADIPVGSQTLAAGAFGFFTNEQEVIVNWEQVSLLDFSLASSLVTGDVRIELTWATARDLDAHLWLPATFPTHIYWKNQGICNFPLYTCLDKDDFAYGPENIRVLELFPGTYIYAVYIFGSGSLTNSAPVIRIYDDTGLLAERHVPLEGDGSWWHVFDLDGITGNITPVDTISNTSPGPYDPEPTSILPLLKPGQP